MKWLVSISKPATTPGTPSTVTITIRNPNNQAVVVETVTASVDAVTSDREPVEGLADQAADDPVGRPLRHATADEVFHQRRGIEVAAIEPLGRLL